MLKLGIGKALGLLILGGALVVGGVAWIYPPAALVIGGAGLTAFIWRGVDIDPPERER